MAERTDQRTRTGGNADADADLDLDDLGLDEEPTTAAEQTGGGLRSRVGSTLGNLFSVRAFLVALVLSVAGLFLGGMIPLLGGIAGLAGVFAAGFLLGAGRERRAYLETVAAGGLASGVGILLDRVVLAMIGAGPQLVVAGAGAGAVAALVGHYFGRDLRDGLTRDV
jgi:hypothetical protein